jgi:hypothetical protein
VAPAACYFVDPRTRRVLSKEKAAELKAEGVRVEECER